MAAGGPVPFCLQERPRKVDVATSGRDLFPWRTPVAGAPARLVTIRLVIITLAVTARPNTNVRSAILSLLDDSFFQHHVHSIARLFADYLANFGF